MPKLYRKAAKAGLPPGTLVSVEGTPKALIRVFEYKAQEYREAELKAPDEEFAFQDPSAVRWINMDGQDAGVIKKIDRHFGIHPLVLEDIINTGQRPKIEDYGEYLFFVIHMIHFDEAVNDIYAEQISLILGRDYVLSFQERPGDVFDPIRQRIREGKGRVRQMGADYLAYALMDAIVDQYFFILEKMGERIDSLEKELFQKPQPDIPLQIHRLKTQVIYLRKQIWPLREVLAAFQRLDSELITKTTGIYLRDVYDHAIRVNDTLEAFREALSGLHDIYLSSISNRMNEIMKVLTIFAAVFIPLTFIAGIYGMNFENMPELKWRYGYFCVLAVMTAVGVGLLAYFKRKGWL